MIVGDVGLQVPRAPYYDKEIDLRLSRSYGPGRYDRAYEERGQDYPIGYVRWTEGRNMSAIVELIGAGRLPVADLISARTPVEEAATAYERLGSEGASPLGVVIEYPESKVPNRQQTMPKNAAPADSMDRASVIGTGSFAQRILIPGLRSAGFAIDTVASATGLSARAATEQISSGTAGSPDDALGSNAGLLVVATRHDSHADLAERAMLAGKAVFVEKPPCLNWEELESRAECRARRAACPSPGGSTGVDSLLATVTKDHFARARTGPVKSCSGQWSLPSPGSLAERRPRRGGG